MGKQTKFIFVTGGVVSSLGKGISAASIGRLLKNRGLKVFMLKFDPYLNYDPGTMSPYQHGEVFVTNDGAETDLDLGHYERFIDENLSKYSNVTTGKIYSKIIEKERRGEYLGSTVQVVPHVTNQIKRYLQKAAISSEADVVITEIGGTVGDIESLPFLEAIRQTRRDYGFHNTMYIHTTLVPFLKAAGEIKTKPTQHSVKELRSLGIQPDVIILRTEVEVPQDQKDKIALLCDVNEKAIIEARDVDVIYEVASGFARQGLDEYICNHFELETAPLEMSEWNDLIKRIKAIKKQVKVAIVGKYVELPDAYLSVSESLKHAGIYHNHKVHIKFVDAETLTLNNISEELDDVSGILVPGGFGPRAIEGKILAAEYARTKLVPYLGLCLGMQIAMIEYARNVLGLDHASSTEFDPNTPYPIFDYLPDQYEGINIGGTLRLGLYDCIIKPGTKAYEAYGVDEIKERHRHRYEFNNQFKEQFENAGMVVSGINPQTSLVEMMELSNHPWFVGCQFHPEFLSRPNKPHPLFKDFIKHAIEGKK
ncbi:MAG TPA: CTP synthase [Bacilli bacterium]|nr:CTP synthase [Bacilli bacterium]